MSHASFVHLFTISVAGICLTRMNSSTFSVGLSANTLTAFLKALTRDVGKVPCWGQRHQSSTCRWNLLVHGCLVDAVAAGSSVSKWMPSSLAAVRTGGREGVTGRKWPGGSGRDEVAGSCLAGAESSRVALWMQSSRGRCLRRREQLRGLVDAAVAGKEW